ncbi:MAG TPA: SIR2 family protein [Methylovorus sp.]|nr:SIR2 family protein [Methylovorus sp.]
MTKIIQGPEFSPIYRLRAKQLAWFLGAGASASAGIPTGYAMIQDFKKRLFCQHSNIKFQDVDSNDPLWIERMDNFFNSRNILPPANHPSEYAVAFEAVYQSPEDRRKYIENAIRQGTPSFAHRVLASLITSQHVPCVFTTNFDALIETATTVTDQLVDAVDRIHLTTAAIDNPDRARRALNEAQPFLAKLHGDFQSIAIKNTTAELIEQDTKMRAVLIEACSRFGLVAVGYSGRDDSVMKALTESLTNENAYPGGIFWVTRSKNTLLPAVTQFLEHAEQLGIETTIVESHTFDELAADLIQEFELAPQLSAHLFENQPEPILREVPLPTEAKRAFPVLLCSAIPIISMPAVARRIKVNRLLNKAEIRDLIKATKLNVIAVSVGNDIAAFGSDTDILQVFAPFDGRLSGTISLNPLNDSWALGLLYDALTKALCRGRPLIPHLRSKGHSVLVSHGFSTESNEERSSRLKCLSNLKRAYATDLIGKIPNIGYFFNEGVQIRLSNDVGKWWCLFEPFTYVKLPKDDNSEGSAETAMSHGTTRSYRPENPVIDWNRERWAGRYNAMWSRIISEWTAMLSGRADSEISAIGLTADNGLDATFKLSPIAGWSRPSHEHDYFLRKGR